jgi:hypothetical protein
MQLKTKLLELEKLGKIKLPYGAGCGDCIYYVQTATKSARSKHGKMIIKDVVVLPRDTIAETFITSGEIMSALGWQKMNMARFKKKAELYRRIADSQVRGTLEKFKINNATNWATLTATQLGVLANRGDFLQFSMGDKSCLTK